MIDYLTAFLQEDEEEELLPAPVPTLPLQKSEQLTEPAESSERPGAPAGDLAAEAEPFSAQSVPQAGNKKPNSAAKKAAGKSGKSFQNADDAQKLSAAQRPQGENVPPTSTAELLQQAAAKKRAAGALTSAAQKRIQEVLNFAELGAAPGAEVPPESPHLKSRNAAALLERLPVRRQRVAGKSQPGERQVVGKLERNASGGGLQREPIDWDKLTEREARRYDGGFSLF